MDAIEELRRIVVQGFASVNDRFDALDAKLSGRIDGLEGGMGRLEGGMGRLEGRMGRLEGRMDGLEGRMDGLEAKMDGLEAKMETGFARVDEAFAYVRRALLDHNEELRKKVDRDEVEALVERAVARAIGS
jgi:predicted nuclease with TOPRIM domain